MLLSSDLRLQPRGLTEQPSKCPRSPVLCSDTSPHTPHRPLQMHTVSRARSVSSVSIGELRRAAKKKIPSKPQHHPEDAQREAGARAHRLPVRHCGETRRWLQHYVPFSRPALASSRSCPARTGTPPDASE